MVWSGKSDIKWAVLILWNLGGMLSPLILVELYQNSITISETTEHWIRIEKETLSRTTERKIQITSLVWFLF